MRYASTTAALALLLAVTSTLAAPVPELIPSLTRTRETIGPVHHEHKHQHHHHHHRVSLAKWVHDHLHYPQHWPFHPHHETQSHHHNHHHDHVAGNNEQPKKSGSMLLFWLHSHFAPHTSKLRTHRGKPISDINQSQRVLSSSFDEKPPSDEDVVEARGLETQSTLDSEGKGPHELHHQPKELHKAGHKLHKTGKIAEMMGEVNDDVVKNMHLHIGLAAAKFGHMDGRNGRREVDDLD